MAKTLPIRILGDDILRRKLQEVDLKDPSLPEYIENLIHTMYERDGVGLASNQVGEDKRIFVIDPLWAQNEDGERNPIVMLNPDIYEMEGEQVYEEGCISLPDIFANVHRALKIKYRYTTPEGKLIESSAEGYEAVVIQHEYDHLNGIVFTDRIGTLTKLKLHHKLKALEASAVNGVNIRKES
ncbi:MAG TPA: peptide deformylase [Candidatus Cloacimonadota bacterium]|jgi:peptide deformylase|nr:peptide deformylase [Candidatus Cloacimonadota bacterium]HRX75837.1 peptide deformylase [Candidatus Cloacimonadota bacterium]